MGSDRARVTYDPKQQYRSVVMQQGRVTLEADWNEAQQITKEEIRREALDFVGPCGTPDNGYSVVLPSQPTQPRFDFSVDGGTMYVGGMRAHLSSSVQYSSQPDWRDYGAEDPDWVDLSTLANSPPTDEFVYLYLREQEVSAVEDPDLKDVALGGPDTAQRTRLVQRIVRVACSATECVSGLAAAQTKWQSEGLFFDPDTMRLRSSGTLEVGFSDQAQAQNACQPQAQGGYVGPDNQLIRVQISGIDSLTGDPKFLWGFDDASFLYRIEVDPGNSQQLNLQTIPVDADHQPAKNQAVEVLRTAADLSNGANVAATSGFVFTLAQNYDPDSHSVQLPSGVSLPADYQVSNQSPPSQLFLRVWQQEVVFTPGQPTPLADTGLTVTLQTTANQPFHTGDYWLFAVRPSTPQIVYPERYRNGFQPPDGPRLWACPLGVIAWNGAVGTLISDCRNQFCNLVAACAKQQGCCTIVLTPQDLSGATTLQTVVNQAGNLTMLVTAVTAGSVGNNIAVEISNVQPNASPAAFDLTVTESEIYTGVSTGTIEDVIGLNGGPGLVHLTGSVNTQLAPLGNQTLTLTGGTQQASAQANVMDSTNSSVVFTLQARNAGVDGNLTQATISNVDTSQQPPTFEVSVTWTKTLPALNLANLFPSISASLNYEILASPPITGAPAFPLAGVTTLSGGYDGTPTSQPSTAQAMIFGAPTSICLKPGSYLLSAPLTFGPELSNITLESCGGPATIGAAEGQENNFLFGLIQLNGASGISLNGLIFAMPQFSLYQSGGNLGGLPADTLSEAGEAPLISINTSVGVLAVTCQDLTVEECTFNFPALQLNDVIFAAGVLASGDCSGINVRGNSFQGPTSVSTVSDSTGTGFSLALAGGFVQSDTLQFAAPNPGEEANFAEAGNYLPSSVDNLSISKNNFQNLAFPVVIASTLGSAKFDANVVTSCLTGFTIFPLAALAQATQPAPAKADQTSLLVNRQVASNAALQRMISISAAYPRPTSLVTAQKIVVTAPAKAADTPKPAAEAAPKPLTSIVDISSFKPVTAGVTTLLKNATVYFGSQAPQPVFQVQFTNNQVDAVVTGGGSSWALLIDGSSSEGTTSGMLTLVGNQLTNASEIFTALSMVDICAATGNIILNRLERDKVGQSLIITNLDTENPPNAAVTGNVFQGRTILPARTSTTLPAWSDYNTTIV